MKFILIFILFVTYIDWAYAQSYFNQITQHNSKNPPNPKNIQYYNDNLVISYGFVDEDDFDKEKTALVVLDKNNVSNKLKEVLLDSVDGGFRATEVIDNSLFVFGNSVRPTASRFITLLKLNQNYEVEKTSRFPVVNFPSYVFNSVVINNKLFIQNNESFIGGISKYNKNCDQLFYKDYLSGLYRNTVWETIKTKDDNIILSSQILYPSIYKAFGQLQKIDTFGNVIWTYRSIRDSESSNPFSAVELSNGSIVQSTQVIRYDTILYEWPPLLRWVDKDGKFIKDATINTLPRTIAVDIDRLRKGNGDYFFAFGSKYDGEATWAWILKLDNDGNIIWSHTYRHPDNKKESILHHISDLLEEENGDITVLGDISNLNNLKTNIWLFRINKNGCFGSDICQEEEVSYITNTTEGVSENIVKIFPNPFQNTVNLSFGNIVNEVSIEITNLQGIKVGTYQLRNLADYQIDLAGKASGIYFIKIVVDKDNVFTYKVSKL